VCHKFEGGSTGRFAYATDWLPVLLRRTSAWDESRCGADPSNRLCRFSGWIAL